MPAFRISLRIITTFLIMFTLRHASASDEIHWTGAVGEDWTDSGNWSGGTRPTATDTAVVATIDGLISGRTATLTNNHQITALVIDVPSFTLSAAAQSRALGVDAVTVSDRFATRSVIFEGGRTPRLTVRFYDGITLTNFGQGEAGFGGAHLVGNGIITFAGPGGWFFSHNSRISKEVDDKQLSLQLPQNYTGGVEYSSQTPLTADYLTIDGGTFTLGKGAMLNTTNPVTVGKGGTFRGFGEVATPLNINGGTLAPGDPKTNGTLTLGHDLILGDSAQLMFRISATGNDALQSSAFDAASQQTVTLGGTLTIDVTSTLISQGLRNRWILLSDFTKTTGRFSRVELVGSVSGTLTRDDSNSTWSGLDITGHAWSFDETNGVLSITR